MIQNPEKDPEGTSRINHNLAVKLRAAGFVAIVEDGYVSVYDPQERVINWQMYSAALSVDIICPVAVIGDFQVNAARKTEHVRGEYPHIVLGCCRHYGPTRPDWFEGQSIVDWIEFKTQLSRVNDRLHYLQDVLSVHTNRTILLERAKWDCTGWLRIMNAVLIPDVANRVVDVWLRTPDRRSQFVTGWIWTKHAVMPYPGKDSVLDVDTLSQWQGLSKELNWIKPPREFTANPITLERT